HMVTAAERLARLELFYNQLAPPPAKAPAPIRALPALVVEDLYAQFDPQSTRNPFRTASARWRNLLIFLLMLHLGLRRGEVAVLSANALKDDFDPRTGATRYWLDVQAVAD
ncbi:hypothetical protein, partial [Klebsiella aerogenes]|uniref:hypothetical protein n=1 Tax=Klebsiella aerogenes TaxID=548 RepID=UPI003F680790